MRVSRRVRLSSRGRALLIVGLGISIAAYLTGRIELLYLGVFLACSPLTALVFVRFRKHQLHVHRQFSPRMAEAGHKVGVAVVVRNVGSTRTGEARWRDALPWAPFATSSSRLRPLTKDRGEYGRDSTVELSYTMEPPRRGVVEIGPLIVDFWDPFGLASGELAVGAQQQLVVPAVVNALPETSASSTAADGSARALQRRTSGAADELMTREYRYGDPLRRVHWRSSAHHGELMVRQDEQRSQARAHLILDTRSAGYRDCSTAGAEEPRSRSFEWALSFTASLALHLERAGFGVDIAETSHRQLASMENREEFLVSTAGIVLVGGAPLPFRRHDPGSSRGTLFGIVADAEVKTLERLISERPHFDRAFAFVVDPRSDAVVGPLREGGFICVAVSSADDPSDVWREAAEQVHSVPA